MVVVVVEEEMVATSVDRAVIGPESVLKVGEVVVGAKGASNVASLGILKASVQREERGEGDL